MIIEDWLSFDGTVVIALNRKEFEEFKSDLHSYDGLIEFNPVMATLLKRLMEIEG